MSNEEKVISLENKLKEHEEMINELYQQCIAQMTFIKELKTEVTALSNLVVTLAKKIV